MSRILFDAFESLGVGLPVLSNVTRSGSIRDRIIGLVVALAPLSLSRDKFRAFRNQRAGDFIEFAETQPANAFRRFQVRDTGDDQVVEVSNTDYDERRVTFRIAIAYPQTARTGADQALDRDDVMDDDFHTIDYSVGIYGRGNFSGTNDCTPLGLTKTVVHGNACDFLELEGTYIYRRSSS